MKGLICFVLATLVSASSFAVDITITIPDEKLSIVTDAIDGNVTTVKVKNLKSKEELGLTYPQYAKWLIKQFLYAYIEESEAKSILGKAKVEAASITIDESTVE